MKDDILKQKQALVDGLAKAATLAEIDDLEQEFVGRKGSLVLLFKNVATLEGDEKKAFGQFVGEVRQEIDAAFTAARGRLASGEAKAREAKEWIDISAPGIAPDKGHLHLTSQAIEEITQIFDRIGFSRVRHPEVDWDWYAFESLNIPEGHPARDGWETFFVAEGEKMAEGEKGKVVLTPHTSNAQVRQMQIQEPPIRMINIGKCYRRQASVRHLTTFHQFEGLFVDKNVTLADLKGIIEYFAKEFFGPDREIRLRPHHFRFTEPSFEVDISAEAGRENEKIFKGGWLELGGAGMVHPNVLRAAGLDPEVYTGFAFGWGIERTMMMKSGMNIADIRVMYENDMRFLEQF
jgi:phenylalanyl-tRNA synthetase alpha chain